MKGYRDINASNLLVQPELPDVPRVAPKLVLPEPPLIRRNSISLDPNRSRRSSFCAEDIDLLSKEECKDLIVKLQARINKIEIEEYKLGDEEVENLVRYEENPLDRAGIDPHELLPRVMKDISDITSECPKQGGISTHWILQDPSLTPFLVGKNISSYQGISDLLTHVRALDQNNECLNSCLLTSYPDGEAKSRLHADDELYICNDSPICNFSIGEQRTVKFFNSRLHSGPPLISIPMNSLSLVTMNPSCQQKLKHIVLPNPQAVGPRFCLSFRNVKPISKKTQDLQQDAEPPTTVLIGTSITKRINPAKIAGKTTCKFVNCSTSGDTIKDASDKLDREDPAAFPAGCCTPMFMSILQGKAVPRNSLTESEQFQKPFLVRNLPLMMREVCPRQKQTIEGKLMALRIKFAKVHIPKERPKRKRNSASSGS
ncbi:hypothetical protein ACHWQZ_G017482 [Mnemiopsis leidyi]